MPYRCIKCKYVIEKLPQGYLTCPNCAGKIFIKERQEVTKIIEKIR